MTPITRSYGKGRTNAEQRSYVLERDGKCAWCGSTRDLVVDNIVGVKQHSGGSLRNKRVLCRSCKESRV